MIIIYFQWKVQKIKKKKIIIKKYFNYLIFIYYK